MRKIYHSGVFALFLTLIAGLFFAQKTYAATLSSVSDTITTSRPSASAPLSSNVAAADTQATVVDNGSIFLASDSATFNADTGETKNSGINVGSYGAASGGNRTIYFTQAIGNTHHAGDAVIVPITATHTVKFTTGQSIPASGHIVVTFPGSGSNVASPSATTFSFNGMTTSNPSDVKFNGVTCSSVSVSAPSIDCTVNGSGVAAGTAVTVLIGCTAQSGGTCTTYAPRLINPTASSSMISGSVSTADTWQVAVATKDSGGTVLDSSSAKIATIHSVQVSATVDTTFTFTLTGLADGTNLNTQNTSCGADTTNAGSAATSTTVSLGTLASGAINKSAQELAVSTNAPNGYVITATSSGRLINPSTGFWITDANGGNGLTGDTAPAPATFGASGTPGFGIHACGSRVNTTTWGLGTTSFSSGAKYMNPWNSGTNGYSAKLASYAGPDAVDQDKTIVEYAATISGTTPSGTYTTVLTYVATPTF